MFKSGIVLENHNILSIEKDDSFKISISITSENTGEIVAYESSIFTDKILSISELMDSEIRLLMNRKQQQLESSIYFKIDNKKEDCEDTFQLSDRQLQILTLLAKGFISKEISNQLFISVNTVNTHRQRILEKLEVKNSTQAVQKAQILGLI